MFPIAKFGRQWRPLAPVCLTLAVALLAGGLASRLGLPLPWMLGPLFVVAGLRVRGAALAPLPGGRQAGQWAIGTALGLYFTPDVLRLISEQWLLVVALAGGSLLVGLCCARLTGRIAGCDRPTAFFASLPGGASEMAVLAERFGGAVDRIAAAHAIRVMLVVAVVPVGLTLVGAHGVDHYLPLATRVDPLGLPLLVAVSLAGTAVLASARIGNAWVLGPLLGAGAVTAFGVELSMLPQWAVNGGQMLIGSALGCRFAPAFFRDAPRFLVAALASALLGVVLSTLLALAASSISPAPLATLVLAAAPGGVAEMCITAKVLQLGVPLVTICHALRVIVLTMTAPALYRLSTRNRGAAGTSR